MLLLLLPVDIILVNALALGTWLIYAKFHIFRFKLSVFQIFRVFFVIFMQRKIIIIIRKIFWAQIRAKKCRYIQMGHLNAQNNIWMNFIEYKITTNMAWKHPHTTHMDDGAPTLALALNNVKYFGRIMVIFSQNNINNPLSVFKFYPSISSTHTKLTDIQWHIHIIFGRWMLSIAEHCWSAWNIFHLNIEHFELTKSNRLNCFEW